MKFLNFVEVSISCTYLQKEPLLWVTASETQWNTAREHSDLRRSHWWRQFFMYSSFSIKAKGEIRVYYVRSVAK